MCRMNFNFRLMFDSKNGKNEKKMIEKILKDLFYT